MTTIVKENPLVRRIEHMNPCLEAVEWLRGYTSAETAWLSQSPSTSLPLVL